MTQEEINQFFDFIEKDLGDKFFAPPKELLQITAPNENKEPQKIHFFSNFDKQPLMKEFDAARILDGNPQLMNFPENPESPKS